MPQTTTSVTAGLLMFTAPKVENNACVAVSSFSEPHCFVWKHIAFAFTRSFLTLMRKEMFNICIFWGLLVWACLQCTGISNCYNCSGIKRSLTCWNWGQANRQFCCDKCYSDKGIAHWWQCCLSRPLAEFVVPQAEASIKFKWMF